MENKNKPIDYQTTRDQLAALLALFSDDENIVRPGYRRPLNAILNKLQLLATEQRGFKFSLHK